MLLLLVLRTRAQFYADRRVDGSSVCSWFQFLIKIFSIPGTFANRQGVEMFYG